MLGRIVHQRGSGHAQTNGDSTERGFTRRSSAREVSGVAQDSWGRAEGYSEGEGKRGEGWVEVWG